MNGHSARRQDAMDLFENFLSRRHRNLMEEEARHHQIEHAVFKVQGLRILLLEVRRDAA